MYVQKIFDLHLILEFYYLSLHHVVSLPSHSKDKVKDVDLSLLAHHLYHALDAD